MRDGIRRLWTGAIACLAFSAAAAQAQRSSYPTTLPSSDPQSIALKPFTLSIQPTDQPESVYAPPTAPQENQGINQGAVHFQLFTGYFSHYIYRGIEVFQPPLGKDRANLQIDSKLSWDLGKLPHPYIAVFVNYSDADPINSFQEIRPAFGADWNVRPFVLAAGNNTYLYPDRSNLQTSEVYGKIQIDDSYFLRTDEPILSPYVYAAYDYDRYNGWYIEAGVSHDFKIEQTGLTLTFNANVAYVQSFELFTPLQTPPSHHDTGMQHYQLGMIGNYSINTLFNFPPRFGEWSIQGSLYYTDGLNNDLRSTTQLWGGFGIMFKY